MKNFSKKTLCLFLSLIFVVSSFVVLSTAATAERLDIAFVLDSTSGMNNWINEISKNMSSYLADLDKSGKDYKVAIVDYRDFASNSGQAADYPYKVQLDFSSDATAINNAIKGIGIGFGGDANESLCSALIDGLDALKWRNDSTKVVIIVTDSPALDPETETKYTKAMALNKLLYNDVKGTTPSSSRSAIKAYTVAGQFSDPQATGFNALTAADMKYFAEKTGGKTIATQTPAEAATFIKTVIAEIAPATASGSTTEKPTEKPTTPSTPTTTTPSVVVDGTEEAISYILDLLFKIIKTGAQMVIELVDIVLKYV